MFGSPGGGSPNGSSRPTLRAGKLPGALLDRLIETYRTRPDPTVLVAAGYGRDAAAIDAGGPAPLIVKSDPITFATDSAADYLVAVNANDIACMGGVPRWLSVVLLLPEETVTQDDVESLFADLQRAANQAGVSVVGGHSEVTSAVTRPVFIGSMIGTAGPAGLLEPGRATPGDDLFLTKWMGLEGTALIAREVGHTLLASIGGDVVERAAFLLSDPGISVSRDAEIVLDTGGVTALHDPTEGGVATAIHELAAASGCGAHIVEHTLPILPQTTVICEHLGLNPLGLISSGALLVASSPEARSDIEIAAARNHLPIARIGHLAEQRQGVTMIGIDGTVVPLPRFDADELTRVL